MRKSIVYILILVLFVSIQSAHAGEVVIIKDNIAVRKSVKSWVEFKNESLIRQKYDYSCGAASLATILKYFFNEQVAEEEIVSYILGKKLTGEPPKESQLKLSFQDIKGYADIKGYDVSGLALPLESPRELKTPAIVYVEIRNYQHFSVYNGMDDQFVYLTDPSFGNMKYRIEKFENMFYTWKDPSYPGKILALIPKSEEKKLNINKNFVKIPEGAEFIYNVIRAKAFVLGS